jgi:hypothetical protein
LPLKDAGLVATSAAAQVGGVDKILDIGSGNYEADIVIDVSACEVATGDEAYRIGVQISDSATFASGFYEVVALSLGDASPLAGDTDMGVGRYIIPFRNQIADGVTKRYLRLYTTVAGTIATGINYKAYVGIR